MISFRKCNLFVLLMAILSLPARAFDTFEIEASLDTLNKQVIGVVRYDLPAANLDTIQFQLFPNAYSDPETPYLKRYAALKNRLKLSQKWGSMSIDSVFVGHADCTGSLEIDYTRGILPSGGGPFEGRVEIYFRTKIPLNGDRLSYKGKDYLLDGWYPRPAILNRDKSWYNPEYGLMAELVGEYYNFEVQFETPSGYLTAGSAPPDSTVVVDGKEKHFFTFGPANDFALAASLDFLTETTVVGGKSIHMYYREFEQGAVSKIMDAAGMTLEYMTEKCGEYHYPDLSLAFCDMGFSGGIEMPGFIAITSPRNGSMLTEMLQHVTIHEVVHEWFYGMVGSDQILNPWMDEAVTEFFTIRIVEKYGGRSGNLLDLWGFKGDIRGFHRMRLDRADRKYRLSDPVQGFAESPDYFDVVYSRGALNLETIDNLLAEKSDPFWKSYFEKYKFKRPDKFDFLGHLEGYLDTEKYDFAFGLIESSGYVDVGVANLNNKYLDSVVEISFAIEKTENIRFPIEYMIVHSNGDTTSGEWASEYDREILYVIDHFPAEKVMVDQSNILTCDANLINNSVLSDASTAPAMRLSSGILFLVESLLSYLGGL